MEVVNFNINYNKWYNAFRALLLDEEDNIDVEGFKMRKTNMSKNKTTTRYKISYNAFTLWMDKDENNYVRFIKLPYTSKPLPLCNDITKRYSLFNGNVNDQNYKGDMSFDMSLRTLMAIYFGFHRRWFKDQYNYEIKINNFIDQFGHRDNTEFVFTHIPIERSSNSVDHLIKQFKKKKSENYSSSDKAISPSDSSSSAPLTPSICTDNCESAVLGTTFSE